MLETESAVEEPTPLVQGSQTLDSVVDSCPPTDQERQIAPDLTAYADDIEDLMRPSRLTLTPGGSHLATEYTESSNASSSISRPSQE